MQWDAEEPAKRVKHRDRLVRATLAELAAFSPFYRQHLGRTRVELRRVEGLADLRRLVPIRWSDVAADPASFVLAPTEAAIARAGERRLVVAMIVGKLLGRAGRVNRERIEPRYKPVHWHVDEGAPVGSTAEDLQRLGLAGARMLSVAGLERRDVVVGLTEPGPRLAHWQTVLGARAAGVSAIHLGPAPAPELVVAARPTTLVGEPRGVLEAAARLRSEGLSIPEVHTVVLTGDDPDAGTRDAVGLAVGEVAGSEPEVVAAWAPTGARALWIECPGGPGFHTYPDLEVLEVARGGAIHPGGPGELIWSGLGWRGTAVFRLLTGASGELVDGTCPVCRRVGPMVRTGSRDALGPVRVLSAEDAVRSFQLELRPGANGADELLVFLALARGAALEPLLDQLDRELRATQYVVLSRRQVDARVRSTGTRVVDER